MNVKIKFRMSKWDIRPQFECQNRILNGKMLCSVQIQSNEKIGFQTSKCNIRCEFESQNRILNVKYSIFGPSSNAKIGFWMPECDIWPLVRIWNSISNVKMWYSAQNKWQNRIAHVKMRYSSWIRMSKKDLECQNALFGPNSNVKIGFRMAKCDIRSQFKWQNRISNVERRYSARNRKFQCQNRISIVIWNAIFAPTPSLNV